MGDVFDYAMDSAINAELKEEDNLWEYVLIIKSHCEYPDWEQSVLAHNKKEATEKFYQLLRGDYDRSFIYRNLIRL